MSGQNSNFTFRFERTIFRVGTFLLLEGDGKVPIEANFRIAWLCLRFR